VSFADLFHRRIEKAIDKAYKSTLSKIADAKQQKSILGAVCATLLKGSPAMLPNVAAATLGVFLLIAARNPYAHKSLIWFTVWSSVVHGAIMGVQGFMDTTERGHLVGDAPALILVAIVLAMLMPRTATLAVLTPQTAQA
jgi:hypothetical protein